MFTKILFTALIVLALLLYVRYQQTKQTDEKPTRSPSKTSPRTPSRSTHRLSRIAAYATLVILLAIGGVFYYLDWKEDFRVMNIRIINANNGEIGKYSAYRSMIRGRSFVTLDGRTITVADSERIEMSEAD